MNAVSLTDPQTWNMYAYVRNNPTTLTDPSGLEPPTPAGGTDPQAEVAVNARPEVIGAAEAGLGGEKEQLAIDLAIGAAKELWNTAAGLSNFMSETMNPGYGSKLPLLESANYAQTEGMIGAGIGMFFIPGAGEEEAAAGTSAMARGLANEAKALDALGLVKNTEKVAGAEGKAIPDALTEKASVEIKDRARITSSRQLRIESEAAVNAQRARILVTGPNTRISLKVMRELTDEIIRLTFLGPR